jgi:hypothetical protein
MHARQNRSSNACERRRSQPDSLHTPKQHKRTHIVRSNSNLILIPFSFHSLHPPFTHPPLSPPPLLGVLVHLRNTSVLEGVLVVVRGSLRGRRRVHLLEAAQVHVALEQRDDVGVEGLPVGVLEVVFLALFWGGVC